MIELKPLNIKNAPEIDQEELEKILNDDQTLQLQRSRLLSKSSSPSVVAMVASPKSSPVEEVEEVDIISNGHDVLTFQNISHQNGHILSANGDQDHPINFISANFYRNIMYSKASKMMNSTQGGDDIECIDISSTEDEAEEEIDDPEEDFDDAVTISEFDDDEENLSLDIEMSVALWRNVPKFYFVKDKKY